MEQDALNQDPQIVNSVDNIDDQVEDMVLDNDGHNDPNNPLLDVNLQKTIGEIYSWGMSLWGNVTLEKDFGK